METKEEEIWKITKSLKKRGNTLLILGILFILIFIVMYLIFGLPAKDLTWLNFELPKKDLTWLNLVYRILIGGIFFTIPFSVVNFVSIHIYKARLKKERR